MKAEDYIVFIEQGRRDKVSPEGLRLIALEYRELLKQRDELREALKELMDGVRGLPPLTAIVGTLTGQYEKAEQALKNSER